jgi:hypothetical protein
MKMKQSLALALAGQVSAGLTPGDGELERARASLISIGLMVLNMSGHDDLVRSTLELSERAHVTLSRDGMSITYTPDNAT